MVTISKMVMEIKLLGCWESRNTETSTPDEAVVLHGCMQTTTSQDTALQLL